ncbi:hypothetical protein NQ314_019667 [Rhamnusium bicolor]|uniref:Uncharacterized protein n=1 Tax=Rhamnusium bicolor TaxID=1586634 RepID=A0AAV8WMM5_9CUCU|nr:hypothetical protein NQ314_019667 [Rhamnusium bicolor]
MEPADFMQAPLTLTSLNCYLGSSNTAEQKVQANKQGIKLLQQYGVIPMRDTPVNCPSCGELLQTVGDTCRFGWRYSCRNHPRCIRFSPLTNTFLFKARLRAEMRADRIVKIMCMWLLHRPLMLTVKYLSLSSETGVYWFQFCRDVACSIVWHEYIPIGGAADVVEVETHLLKYKRKLNEAVDWHYFWVQYVDNSSYICTDYGPEYAKCRLVFNDHGKVEQPNYLVEQPTEEKHPLWMPVGRFNEECLNLEWKHPPPRPGMQPFRNNTDNIRSAWVNLKSQIGSSYSIDNVRQYIGEWMYRRNILQEIKDDNGRFERFLRDVGRAHPGLGKVPMRTQYEDILKCDCHECHR